MSLGIIVIAVSSIWVGSEIALGRLKYSDATAARQDKSSLRLLWTVILTAIVSGFLLSATRIGAIHTGGYNAVLFGLILIVTGLVLRWIAILTLWKYFTVDVAITGDHKLIDTGLYRYIRHPAYSGSLLSFFGLGLAFSNWLSLLVVFVPITAAFVHRIRVEERVLAVFLGDQYVQYCAATKRLVPMIY